MNLCNHVSLQLANATAFRLALTHNYHSNIKNTKEYNNKEKIHNNNNNKEYIIKNRRKNNNLIVSI